MNSKTLLLLCLLALVPLPFVTAQPPTIAPAPSLPPKFVVGDVVAFQYSAYIFTVRDVQPSSRGYNVDVTWYEPTTGKIEVGLGIPQACFQKWTQQ